MCAYDRATAHIPPARRPLRHLLTAALPRRKDRRGDEDERGEPRAGDGAEPASMRLREHDGRVHERAL